MTGQAASNKALLDTLLSSLDSDAELHVEFKSPKTTLHFGAPGRLEDADARVELKTKSGEEEEIRSICEKALQSNISPNSVDFKGIFEEPGEKTLYVEIRKSRNPGDGRVARILESDFGSQSEGRKSDGDVYEPRLADYILQQSANSLLLSGQEDPHYMEIESGQVESTIGVNYMRRQDGTGSANEEMLETAHAIVNMADLKPNTVVPGEEYHEEGMPRRRQRVAVEPKELVGVPKECPRCKSKYVKFKYFNNKKLNQPRYQCLSCKDFFTHGGKKLATEAVSPSAGGSAIIPMLVEGSIASVLPYQQVENKGKERKRKAKEPPQFANLEKLCRKCGSKNTAFKYLNNGQQDQPRYKCLDCKAMFQLHNKRVRPSSSGDVNNATLLSDLSKETTSVESASAPHETLLMITGPRSAKQSERKRKAMEPEHLVGVIKPCPSCKKLKTRFKYFNNKNLNQPRYECLDCHCYFTYKGDFDQVRRDAFGGDQGAGTSTTTAVNEGKIESASGIGQDGRGKEVEEGNISLTARSDSKLIFGTDISRLDGEDVREGDANAMDSGDFKARITDGSTGPGSNEGIGNNVSVRDTGEVINVQQGLDQAETGEEEKDADTTVDTTDPRRLLDTPRKLLDPSESPDTHDKVPDSTGVEQ
jgi:transposase-like protein